MKTSPEYQTWAAALLVSSVLATWLTFSHLQNYQNGDSLIPVLASLQKWTPFFWEQDRIGMLVPFVALPIRSPIHNLLFQSWICLSAASLTPLLAMRYMLGNDTVWVPAGVFVNVVGLATLPAAIQFDWLVAQPYGVSLALGFSALILLERPSVVRGVLAFCAMTLAAWVNCALFLSIGALVLMHGIVAKQRRDFTRALPNLAVATAIGLGLMSVSRYHQTKTGVSPPAEWVHRWTLLARSIHEKLFSHSIGLLWLVIAGTVVLVVLAAKRQFRLKAYALFSCVFFAAGVVNFLIVGTLVWVWLNGFFPRYAYPALLLFFSGVAILSMAAAVKLFGSKATTVVLAILLGVATGFRYGAPSPGHVRREFDQRFGRWTPAILSMGASVIAGDYWQVWPAVFHANMRLYKMGQHDVIYGLTWRSVPTDVLWDQSPSQHLCVAVLPNDPHLQEYLGRPGIHVAQTQRFGDIAIYQPGPYARCERISNQPPSHRDR